MAVTNMQIWNPSQNNTLTDAQYTANTQRANGAAAAQLFPSALANKLFTQVTTYLTALFTSLANKGYGTSDQNFTTLTQACSNILTKADFGLQVVPYASSVSFNAAQASSFKVTLNGNLSFSVANPYPGQIITFIFNSGAGNASWTLTWPSNVASPGVPDLTDQNVNNVQSFICDDTYTLRPLGPMTIS
jgi:hypothetical protein